MINGQDEAHYPIVPIAPRDTRSDWLITFTGRKVHILDPQPEDIDIKDIAWALSQTCRFGGHTLVFYSVAEHCCRASWAAQRMKPFTSSEANRQVALWALLHDAAEAYLGDVISPLKTQLSEYKAIEQRWQSVIETALTGTAMHADGLAAQFIKEIDMALLMRERVSLIKGDLLFPDQEHWLKKHRYAVDPIGKVFGRRDAFALFTNQFHSLTEEQS